MKAINENYFVDEHGNVYSRPRRGTKGGLVKPYCHENGYFVVMLSPSRVPVKVHRLVAELYVPNPDGLPQVNHLDGNKLNNHYTNLEWCSNQRNAEHANDMGLINRLVGESNPSAKLTEQQVKEIRSLYKPHCRTNGSRALARRYGVEKSTVLRAATGQDWKHVV